MTITADRDALTPTAERGAEEVEVLIVGSGFSGLGMAIRLKREGIEDFAVLERAEDVGGTWHYNTYPGCGCDVPSHLYSFSFAPNPDWRWTYSRQEEIRDYLRDCADRFGIRPHVRFRTDFESAAWDDEAGRWRVDTSAGAFSARVLVAGPGPLAEPKIPDIPGLEDFEGRTFHSARWERDFDPTGKRLASIGTGASAIQYVPEIQPKVERLHVFQRTAPWVLPHTNRPTTRFERRLYRALPAAQKLVRAGIYAGRETFVVGFTKRPRVMKAAEALARAHMRKHIDDPELLEKVTPDYTIGCKRILPSNKWYPALARPNVELVTERVKEVRRRSIVSADGREREVDAIVFGTGFHVLDMPIGDQVRGRDGTLLSDVWQGSPHAYLGATVPGFPNFFTLLGPNTGLGHSSMVYMIESQLEYVMEALRAVNEHAAGTIEVRADAEARYNAELDERMDGTVWNTGCTSWYLDDTGRNGALWPDWTWRFRRRAKRFDVRDHVLAGRRAAVGAAA